MWCARIRKQLSAHADGELSLSEARAIEEHVSQCERCACEQRSLQQLARLTALVPDEDLPTGLHARIMSAVQHTSLSPVPAAPSRSRRAIPVGSWGFAVFSGSMAALMFGVLHAQVNTRPNRPTDVAVDVRPVEKPSADADTPDVKPHRARKVAESISVRTAQPGSAVAQVATELPPSTETRPAVPEPTRRAANTSRVAVAARVSPSRADIRTPAPVTTASNSGGEKPAADAGMPAMASAASSVSPGDPPMPPAVAMAVRTEPSPSEKEPVTRMATNPMEPEPAKDEDEGLSTLKNFLRDRNRSVPQPPLLDPAKDRHSSRRSL